MESSHSSVFHRSSSVAPSLSVRHTPCSSVPSQRKPMSHATHPVGSVRYHAEKSLEQVSPALELAARIGYAAKGVVYIVVGGLAVLAAFGKSGGQTTGS